MAHAVEHLCDGLPPGADDVGEFLVGEGDTDVGLQANVRLVLGKRKQGPRHALLDGAAEHLVHPRLNTGDAVDQQLHDVHRKRGVIPEQLHYLLAAYGNGEGFIEGHGTGVAHRGMPEGSQPEHAPREMDA